MISADGEQDELDTLNTRLQTPCLHKEAGIVAEPLQLLLSVESE